MKNELCGIIKYPNGFRVECTIEIRHDPTTGGVGYKTTYRSGLFKNRSKAEARLKKIQPEPEYE